MPDDAIVVPHKRRDLHGLFGFLTVVWIAVLLRGHGAGVWVVVLFGALLVATVALWVHFWRRPPRLEVSHDAITYSHRGRPRAQELRRDSGELYIRRSGGKYPQAYLCVVGSDKVGIALSMFDRDDVVRACEAMGWRFA